MDQDSHEHHSGKMSSNDVRMRGFAKRHTVAQALAWLDSQVRLLPTEVVPLRAAAGRILATALVSKIDVPGFDRAMMDGYAVAAESTDGAASYTPVPLTVIGESMAGQLFSGMVGLGQAVCIMTGAPMPRGSDSVLPAEWADPVPAAESIGSTIHALTAVSPGKNLGRCGEDILCGTIVLDSGRILRPQDLGVLSSIGEDRVPVVGRPRVRLVITGNELVPAGSMPRGVQIADANGPMLEALVHRDGGIVDFPGLVRDEREAISEALHADADIVVVSGGSSVGIEDFAPTLVAECGELAVHGIAMRPSSPTGLGRIAQRIVVLLPGNPVSALCGYDFFAGRAIRALGGRAKEWPYRSVPGNLSRKISSSIGRLDYVRVQIKDGSVDPIAVGGASLLSSTTRADGFVIVDDDSEGFAAGAEVRVWLYD